MSVAKALKLWYGVASHFVEAMMTRQKVARFKRSCVICGTEFEVGGRSGALTKEYCSKPCATAGAHKKERAAGKPRRNGWEGHLSPTLAAVEHPTTFDIAYAAGFYDGEGSCQQAGRTSCRLHIGQKDPFILYRFQRLFGGRISTSEINNAPFYDWQLHGARARGFLMTIYSFLSPRRQEQVRAAVGMREAA